MIDFVLYEALSTVTRNPDSFLARYHWISYIQLTDPPSGKLLDQKNGYCMTKRGAERRAKRWRRRLLDRYTIANYTEPWPPS